MSSGHIGVPTKQPAKSVRHSATPRNLYLIDTCPPVACRTSGWRTSQCDTFGVKLLSNSSLGRGEDQKVGGARDMKTEKNRNSGMSRLSELRDKEATTARSRARITGSRITQMKLGEKTATKNAASNKTGTSFGCESIDFTFQIIQSFSFFSSFLAS